MCKITYAFPKKGKKRNAMPKITVIMPSLNVAKYICACMNSVIKQTLQDMEVLVIDAGSTDGTVQILEEYASKDERIQIIHSECRSYGYQVNIGLEIASGEYISIVETDDMIAEKMYEILYQAVKEEALDYVKCGYTSFVELDNGMCWNQPGGICIGDRQKIGKIISPKTMPELAIQDYYLWAGIYQREFLRNIRLSETPGAAFQDIGFLYQVLSTADKAKYLADSLYYYRQTRENSSYNVNGFHYLLDEYRNIERMLPQKSDLWRQAYYERMFRQVVGRFQKMAVGGGYWENTAADLQKLQEQLKDAQALGVFQPEKMSKDNQDIYDKLLNSPEKVYEEECAAIESNKQKLYDLLGAVGDKEIVIFGCGSYGRYIYTLLEAYKAADVCAFCDNNKELWHTSVQGVEVVEPVYAVGKYPDAQYVIASKKTKEIYGQLLGLGIEKSQICRCDFSYDIKLFLL